MKNFKTILSTCRVIIVLVLPFHMHNVKHFLVSEKSTFSVNLQCIQVFF